MSADLVSLVRTPQRAMRFATCDGPKRGMHAVELLAVESSAGLQVVRRRVCLTRNDAERFFNMTLNRHRVPVLDEQHYALPAFPDLAASSGGRAA